MARGWFLAYLDDIQVVYMDGRVDDPSFDAYLDAVREDIDQRDPDLKLGVLYDVPEPSALSATRRTRLGELLKTREEVLRQTTSAFALVTGSAVVRGGLKIVFWLAPPPYRSAVEGDLRRGFGFVAKHHPRPFDPGKLATRYEALRATLQPDTTR